MVQKDMECTCLWVAIVLLLVTAIATTKATDADENTVSRSYINKHSSSWRSFAIANDITKREKLKKALRDALNSVDSRTHVERASIDRIKHAASLLKEFQQIHKLSEAVKRTFVEYKTAKVNLSKTINSDNSIDMLKRFLVGRSKRTSVPHAQEKPFKVGPYVIKDLVLDRPHYLKHTDKISVIATPLNKTGEVGIEFISVDPKTSTVGRAKKAFRAAKILLNYVGSKKGRKNEHVDGLVEKLRKDIDGLYQDNNEDSNVKKKKSLFPNKASLLLFKDQGKPVQKGLAHITNSTESKEGSTGSSSLTSNTKSELQQERIEEAESAKHNGGKNGENEKNESKKSDTEKIELASKNSEATKSEYQRSETKKPIESDDKKDSEIKKLESEKVEIKKPKENVKVEEKNDSLASEPTHKTTAAIDEASSKETELLQKTLKQEETIKTLKEAKVARQKYEMARHELAEKVKELYKMANQYEKDETDNQVLEVKNDAIPKAVTDKAVTRTEIEEDNVHVPHMKRDDSHPGMALSGVSNQRVKGISTADPNDGVHRAFTMGTADRREHQVTVDEDKEKHTATKTAPMIRSSKSKALDLGVPSNVKLNELQDEVGKNMRSQEESLKVIAQAIKEDMKDIANVDKKKKMLTEALESNHGEKKDKQSNDKIDEYLTKALSDIMGSDSVPGNEAGKQAEDKQKERTEHNTNTNENNMKIVAEAMKSATKPNIQLPLVSTNGDKISINGKSGGGIGESPQQRNTNDILEHVTDHKKPLDIHDPNNKALLDKASHLEEQVAAQQDKLYSGEANDGPAPAKPNIELTPDQPSSSSKTESNVAVPAAAAPPPAAYAASPKKDVYSSIKETQDDPEERHQMAAEDNNESDDDDEDDDEDDEDDYRRHHGHHPRHYDDDDDRDDDRDDDDEDDRRGHVPRYRDEDARKRSFSTKPISPHHEETESNVGEVHYDNLEDVKRSKVPKLPEVD